MTTTIDIWSPTTSGEPFDKATLIERALALAGMGAWSCDLANSSLLWTAGIYDLFGLPAGTRVDRRDVRRGIARDDGAAARASDCRRRDER
jgi:hypothetical protein